MMKTHYTQRALWAGVFLCLSSLVGCELGESTTDPDDTTLPSFANEEESHSPGFSCELNTEVTPAKFVPLPDPEYRASEAQKQHLQDELLAQPPKEEPRWEPPAPSPELLQKQADYLEALEDLRAELSNDKEGLEAARSALKRAIFTETTPP